MPRRPEALQQRLGQAVEKVPVSRIGRIIVVLVVASLLLRWVQAAEPPGENKIASETLVIDTAPVFGESWRRLLAERTSLHKSIVACRGICQPGEIGDGA
jgi:hypothetical protein